MRRLLHAGPWGAYVRPDGRFLAYQMDPWWLPEGCYEVVPDHPARVLRFVPTDPTSDDDILEARYPGVPSRKPRTGADP